MVVPPKHSEIETIVIPKRKLEKKIKQLRVRRDANHQAFVEAEEQVIIARDMVVTTTPKPPQPSVQSELVEAATLQIDTTAASAARLE